MKYDSKAEAAFLEYLRLVGILDNELYWERPVEPDRLEAALGCPVIPTQREPLWSAGMKVFDSLIVDAVADALVAGVTQKDLTESRGWLSHNDIRGYISRASKPYSSNYAPDWSQRIALRTIQRDVASMAETDPAESAKLAVSARTFLGRWARQIPTQPSEAQLGKVAARWRDEHVRLWQEARQKLLAEIRILGSRRKKHDLAIRR